MSPLWNRNEKLALPGMRISGAAVDSEMQRTRGEKILETPEILPDAAVPRPKDYSIADFAEKAFQLFDADRTEVTLLCDAVAMNSVLDHFGDRAKTTPVDEHTFRLTAEVSLSPTFFAWVFQFGGKVKIVGPEEAIEKYQALLQASAL